MKTLTKLLATTAFAAGLAVSASANAATVMSIKVVIDSVVQSLGVYSQTNTHTFFDGTFGDIGLTVTGNAGSNPLISTQSLDAINPAATGTNTSQLASAFMTAGGPELPVQSTITNFPLAGGPYALATEYHLHTVGAGQSNSTITIESAVPETATWALMIMGFGGVGALVRNRRRALSFA